MPELRVVLDGIVPSGESSRRSSANGRRLRQAHGARLDKDAVSTGPRCGGADDALPTARSIPRNASLATSFEQPPERPRTTSTAKPAAPGIGIVSPDAPGRSDVSSCALRSAPFSGVVAGTTISAASSRGLAAVTPASSLLQQIDALLCVMGANAGQSFPVSLLHLLEDLLLRHGPLW